MKRVVIVTLLAIVAAGCIVITPPAPDAGLAQPPPSLGSAPAGSPQVIQYVLQHGLVQKPWDVEFAPDEADAGSFVMLFTEKPTGHVYADRAWGSNDLRTEADLVDLGAPSDFFQVNDPTITTEDGMLGLAVHPDFETTRSIYLCYTTATDLRVQRFEVPTGWAPGSLTPALDGSSNPIVLGGLARGLTHMGCRIRFQPGTGDLFITVGDGHWGPNPQARGRTLDYGGTPTLGGKVLRVDAELAPVPGNPGVVDPASGFDPHVFTYGHRNPQGIAFHPTTAEPYSSEHGPNFDDEVNHLVAGGNGGWDPYDTASPPLLYKDDDTSMTNLSRFPSAMHPVWRSGPSTLAPSGCDFLHDAVGAPTSRWGPWDGALVCSFLKARALLVMFFSDADHVSGTWGLYDIGTSFPNGKHPRLRSATIGPDGNLYVTTDAPNVTPPYVFDDYPGEILKLVPVSASTLSSASFDGGLPVIQGPAIAGDTRNEGY